MLRAVLAMLLLVACRDGGDACEDAIEKLWQRKVIGPSTRGVAAAAVATCRETRWSSETRACMTSAASNEDRSRCLAVLTSSQREAMDRASAAVGLTGARDLRDRMCACRSAACAEPLEREKTALDVTLQGARHRDPVVKESWSELANQMTDCWRRSQ